MVRHRSQEAMLLLLLLSFLCQVSRLSVHFCLSRLAGWDRVHWDFFAQTVASCIYSWLRSDHNLSQTTSRCNQSDYHTDLTFYINVGFTLSRYRARISLYMLHYFLSRLSTPFWIHLKFSIYDKFCINVIKLSQVKRFWLQIIQHE